MSDARPDVKSWQIDSFKISRFLLAATHKDNKGRAKFFGEFGFDASRPEELARALLHQPRAAHSCELQTGRIGEVRLAYRGVMDTPDGRGAHVKTVWNYDDPGTARFITVTPLPRLK